MPMVAPNDTHPGNGIRRPLLWSAAAAAAAGGARFVALLVLARLLSPAEFGRVAWALWTAELVATFATAGWTQAVTRYTAELLVDHGRDVARGAARQLMKGAAGGILVGALIWGGVLGWRETWGDALVWVAFALYGVSAIGAFAPAWLQGCQAFATQAGMGLAGGALALVGGVTGGLLAGAPGALGGLLLGVLPAMVVTLRVLVLPASAPAGEIHMRARRFAVVTAGATILSALVWMRTEILLLEFWAPPEVVGRYAAALLYAGLVVQVALLGRGFMLPHFTAQRGDRDRARSYAGLTRLLAWILLPGCVLGAALAPGLVPLLWGPQYADSWPLFAVLAAGGLVQVFSAGGALASSMERHRFVFGMSAVGAAVFGVASLLLIPPLGEWGAVVARFAGQWFMGIGGAVYLARVLDVRVPWALLVRPAGAAAIAAMLAVAVMLAWPGAGGTVAALVMGLVAYAGIGLSGHQRTAQGEEVSP